MFTIHTEPAEKIPSKNHEYNKFVLYNMLIGENIKIDRKNPDQVPKQSGHETNSCINLISILFLDLTSKNDLTFSKILP